MDAVGVGDERRLQVYLAAGDDNVVQRVAQAVSTCPGYRYVPKFEARVVRPASISAVVGLGVGDRIFGTIVRGSEGGAWKTFPTPEYTGFGYYTAVASSTLVYIEISISGSTSVDRVVEVDNVSLEMMLDENGKPIKSNL